MKINQIFNKLTRLVRRILSQQFLVYLTSIFILTASPAFADRQESVRVVGHIFGSNDIDSPVGPDAPIELGKISPWEDRFVSEAEDPGAWVYANEAGRVRSQAYTGKSFAPSQHLSAVVSWSGTYTRGMGSANPTFTLNESNIAVAAQLAGRGLLNKHFKEDGTIVSVDPYASMDFRVDVCANDEEGKLQCYDVFDFFAKMQGFGPDLKTLEVRTGTDVTTGVEPFQDIDPIYSEEEARQNPVTKEFILPRSERVFPGGLLGYFFKIPGITREIDLASWKIKPGDEYSVSYFLFTQVGEDSQEHYAQAILGDPLDVDAGGFTLNVDPLDLPSPSNALLCDEAPDPARYSDQEDGTVIDTHTGLMWQRCPLGYALDDINTDDLTDDLCVADTVTTTDWQTALVSADTNAYANYDDWILPNVKQLESLVELSCFSAKIDSRAFPDTPPTGFWTSTQELNAEQAWQVSFGFGDVYPTSKSQVVAARLVRNSGVAPVTPAPGLFVNDARVEEGDTGTTSMDFLLTLTRPASVDVTVDYQTDGFTATEGDDYEIATGTVTIPAGELEAVISVILNGDTTVERNETLQLVITNPSPDLYFSRSAALGVIVDDEPRISVAPNLVSQDEGDLGTEGYAFEITLDKPAAALVSIDYTTVDGTALAGEDYVFSLGTALINMGESSASVIVIINGDTTFEDDETFQLVISNPMGATLRGSATATGIILNDEGGIASYQALNDTGQRHFSSGNTYCANATSALLSCPQAGFPNQDGEFGRDVTDNDDSDGIAGFSFTKLDEDGVALADQTLTYQFETWECVKDEVTGLIWETKTDVPADLRHYDWTYSWYNGTGVNDGGEPGTENGGICADATNCDTEKYVDAVNAAGVCGYSDWRLPSLDELYTIGVAGTTAFGAANGLDDEYFPHNYSVNGNFLQGFTYWSSNSLATAAQSAWVLEFQAPDPLFTQTSKSDTRPVRLVRGDNAQ